MPDAPYLSALLFFYRFSLFIYRSAFVTSYYQEDFNTVFARRVLNAGLTPEQKLEEVFFYILFSYAYPTLPFWEQRCNPPFLTIPTMLYYCPPM